MDVTWMSRGGHMGDHMGFTWGSHGESQGGHKGLHFQTGFKVFYDMLELHSLQNKMIFSKIFLNLTKPI